MASEDGWEPAHAGPDILEWITVPGTNPPVSLQLMKGWPLAILRAFAADFNAYVEKLRDADSAAFTPTNSVATSNHLNGTAMDLNWNSHRFQISYDGFSADQIATCRELLDWYEGTIQWGQDWGGNPFDCMHWNLGYNTYNNPHTGDFIARKIRPDGFSTFRRGAAPPPAPGLTARTLSDAMGGAVSIDRYAQLLPGVRAALQQCGCQGNLNRIAMWLAQIGEESGGLRWMEEIASGSEYEGRNDLGNTQPGDGVRFKGRGPIQITGRSNYARLSQWAFSQGYVPSATFFVDQPAQLASDNYGFLGAVWYWTVARPQINSLCDAGDVVGVTRAINGGTNGLQDRTDRWNRCRAMGLAALDVTGSTDTGDDELSAEAERMIRELYDEYKSNRRAPSRSFFAKDQNWGETPLGFEWNMDGNINEMYMTWGYLLGVSSIESAVEFIADNGVAPASWAGSMVDDTGKRWLSEVGQQWCQGLVALRAAMQKAFRGQPALTAAAPEPQVVYVDRPVSAPMHPGALAAIAEPAPTPEPANLPAEGTTGQQIGVLYDALEQLRLADALPIEARAPLSALISVLSTKNGSQL